MPAATPMRTLKASKGKITVTKCESRKVKLRLLIWLKTGKRISDKATAIIKAMMDWRTDSVKNCPIN